MRSLVNLAHERVWFAGYRPRWVVGEHIVARRGVTKYRTSTANLKAACEHEEVSDPFVLMNDDFFILQPAEIPTVHRGFVTEVVADYLTRYGASGPYVTGALATRKLLMQNGYPEPLSYELHMPLVIHKEAMLATIAFGGHLAVLHKRTAYGNMARLGGEKVPDCKITDLASIPSSEQVFVSTDDHSFDKGAVGAFLRARFTQPSPYERGERLVA